MTRPKSPSPSLGQFPCGSAGKESACNAGDLGSIPGLGRSPGERKGYPPTLVFWPGEIHGLEVAKSQTGLSDFHFHSQRCPCRKIRSARFVLLLPWQPVVMLRKPWSSRDHCVSKAMLAVEGRGLCLVLNDKDHFSVHLCA